jgi:hypothetical protein
LPGFSGRKAVFGRAPFDQAPAKQDCRSDAAQIANPDFPTGFGGLPWDFERQQGLGRPPTGSALHHLVTSVSVKKALMDQDDLEVMLPAHTPPKYETAADSRIARMTS